MSDSAHFVRAWRHKRCVLTKNSTAFRKKKKHGSLWTSRHLKKNHFGDSHVPFPQLRTALKENMERLRHISAVPSLWAWIFLVTFCPSSTSCSWSFCENSFFSGTTRRWLQCLCSAVVKPWFHSIRTKSCCATHKQPKQPVVLDARPSCFRSIDLMMSRQVSWDLDERALTSWLI